MIVATKINRIPRQFSSVVVEHNFHCCDKVQLSYPNMVSRQTIKCRDKILLFTKEFSQFFVATENLLLRQSSGHLFISLLRQFLALSRQWLLLAIAKSVVALILTSNLLFFFCFSASFL